MEPRILHVVLECQECDGYDRIWLVGVFSGEEKMPPSTPGRTRQVCDVFADAVMNCKVFKIGREVYGA